MKKQSSIRELRSFLLLWGSQTVSQLGTAMVDYALIIWVYGQEGTASSITLLTLCTFLPTIFFRFLAGSFVDRRDKRRVMLTADLIAACGTLSVLILYSCSALQVWHLYVINFLLSFMNAFQEPASFVATSLLVPKEYYTKAGGIQGAGGAAVSILSPALGAVLLSFGGLKTVLVCDLVTFAAAFLVLLFLIRIPEQEKTGEGKESFTQTCMGGINFLREHKAILRMTLFLAVINFLAKLSGDGMLSPFILARSGNNQTILGAVQSSVAVGLLAGSVITTAMKPVKSRTRLIFITTGLIFTGNIIMCLTDRPWLWCAANIWSYALAAMMNANMDTVMRENIPAGIQGRVFSAKSTLQNFTIPPALFLGGILADHVFEPFMASDSSAVRVLSIFFGTGKGTGIGLMFLIVGIGGMLVSFTQLSEPLYMELEQTTDR